MATGTLTLQKPTFVRPSRTYDYLYDPIFQVSSDRDHAKESFKAHTSVDRIRYVPNFPTMFSSLRHYPRQMVTLDTTDPVPAHVPRQWRGYTEQARETLIRYKKFNYDPMVSVPPRQYSEPEVAGRNRYRYFRRPIIPFLPQMPPNVVLAPTRVDPMAPPTPGTMDHQASLSNARTRTVMTQTDYRDSETQTDPYSPEYVVRPGSQPELLTLASLTYGHGLPAGVREVEMIQRARAKRLWEATLPPMSDPTQLDKRRRMMEEQERKEWSFREQEIEKLQDERMEVLKTMLYQREVDHQALNDKRLEHLWSKKQQENDRQVRRLRSDHIKALRKLSKKSSNVEGKLERTSVIQQYSNFDSQVYAPMTRIGVYLDSGSEQYTVKNWFTTTLDGLMELEDSLPDYIVRSKVKPPQRHARAIGIRARQQAKLGSILEQVHSDLIKEKSRGQEPPKPLRFLERVEKPVPRPPTPTVSCPEAGLEETEQAVVLLQRLIRGRAIQNKMFEGKECRRQLIEELRTTHALQGPEQQVKKQEAEAIEKKQLQERRLLHKESMIQDGVETPAALMLGRQLDFLNKELTRLQEERRISAFVMLAERQRRIREAEESGERQREERMRRIEDEIFKQMMKVHQGSVDTYLEDVIMESVDSTADQQAREEIRRQADSINKIAHEFTHTELSGKELVAEMVYSFLLPEVEKETMRRKVHHGQRRHLLAAHKIIHGEIEKMASESTSVAREEDKLEASTTADDTDSTA